jgi:hypothetical protein
MQEDQVPICKGCSKECNISYNKCDRCPDYSVCRNCFNNKSYYHHHPLTLRSSGNMIGVNNIMNLKKISEQV